jgi:hypothetical protein
MDIRPLQKLGGETMGIIRNHLNQMKAENPSEYNRLMEDYKTEDELVRDVCGLSVKAINYYLGGTINGSSRFNTRRIRSTK